MSKPSPENALDHVVVVMFENRSFDNLLGRLYEPGELAEFEGAIGKGLSNPVPEWVEHRAGDGAVPYGVSPTMNTPDPDSGEEFPHINTQLFGILDEGNLGVYQPESSFNAPGDGRRPTMDGFVADYANVLLATLGRQPTRDEYSQIMTGYAPEQMPVMSALARGFATFDHWFCDVPTCTFPNRSFFHAGSSSGYVVNTTPADSFPAHNTAETLFERLESAGLTWKVYCDPPSHYSLTGVIHAPRLHGRFATNFVPTSRFFEDAEGGTLPTYSFVEPQIIGWNHNDMHPPFAGSLAASAAQDGVGGVESVHFDPPSSLIAGEDLLARLYEAIRGSSSATGSNHLNTTLLVTFDEHGGTYDHVPPPPAVPPHASAGPGQFGFAFDRAGVRVPTLAISAWIPERTVDSDMYLGTSLLATMRERWNLGAPFTARDAGAPSFARVSSLRDPRPVPAMPDELFELDAPLGDLGHALVSGAVALARSFGKSVPDTKPDPSMSGAQALALAREALGDAFPLLRGER